MNLIIKNIILKNFRNYEDFEIGDFGYFNIFVGNNGIGKTNLIEAIQLLTTLESFRNPKWEETIRWGSEELLIKANLESPHRNLEVAMRAIGNRRSYKLNGKSKSRGELMGLLPAVLFSPDDLKIVKGSAENRRDAIDSMGTQISSTYYDLKNKYQKAIKQKNVLLQSDDFDVRLLDPWNENISIIGSGFVKHRLRLYLDFRKNLLRTYKEMVRDSEIDIRYSPSWSLDEEEFGEIDIDSDEIRQKFLNKLTFMKEAEIGSRRSLVGPHRDDIHIYLNGYDSRKYASQGQQRFISLAWKIAEMTTISQICNQQPILLLDDVMSELDQYKRDVLGDYLIGNTQTFVTATDVNNLDDSIIEQSKVFDIGKLIGNQNGA